MLVDSCLCRIFVSNERLHIIAAHVFCNLVCLPLLEAEAHTLMTIILIICLILVILDLDEITVNGVWIQCK